MDRPTYLTKLACIEQELPKLANTLNAMKITDTVSYGKIYEELSLYALHGFNHSSISSHIGNPLFLLPER